MTSPPFVGRAAELAALEAAAVDAAARLVVVLVGGEGGIGKSRLVAEFGRRLPAEASVLVGNCLELGAENLPYAPFRSIVRRLVDTLGLDAVAGLLPSGGRRGLAHWLPELGDPLPDGSNGRVRLFDDLRTLLERAAAGRRLVVVLEDLHWADASSRELLLYLVHALTAAPLLLIGTYRPADPEPLAALTRAPSARTLTPAPLDYGAVAQLLAGREADLVAAVLARSEGNPLFVEALAEAGSDVVPERLRDLLLAGYRDLPDASRAVARVVAIGGDRVGHDLLAAVAGLDGPALEAVLRPAFERRLLVGAGHGYAFRHALFRAAVAAELLPGERRRVHRGYAEALAASPNGPVSAALAAHWEAAGEIASAFDAGWLAAQAAAATLAQVERARLLDRLVGWWGRVPDPAGRIGLDRDDLLRLAAEACLSAGDTGRGIAHATEAVSRATDPERIALLLELRSLLVHRQGEDGVDDLRAALRLLPPEASRPRARLLATLASRLNVLGTPASQVGAADGKPAHGGARVPGGASASGGELGTAEAAAVTAASEALRLARQVGDRAVEALALVTLADRAASTGDLAGARAMAADATRLAEAVEDYDTILLATVMEIVSLKQVGDHRTAAAVAVTGLATAARAGLSQTRGAVLAAVRADSLLCLGDWSAARALVGAYLALDPPRLYRAVLLTCLGSIALVSGDLDGARDSAAEAAAVIAGGYSGRVFGLPLLDLRARIALAAGRPGEARELLAPVLADRALGSRPDLAWPLLVTAAAAVGSADQIRAVAAMVPATTPVNAAFRATMDAELTGVTPTEFGAGRPTAEPTGVWAEAVAAWRPLDQPYPLATALFHAAEAALNAGDRPAAIALAREADGIAADLGAVVLRREIALLATRGRLAPRDGSGDDQLGLTARELDVLKLVTEGRTNRQIAEELFISVKTAGVHVSNILGKLGVRTRTEAAATAHRRRLFG